MSNIILVFMYVLSLSGYAFACDEAGPSKMETDDSSRKLTHFETPDAAGPSQMDIVDSFRNLTHSEMQIADENTDQVPGERLAKRRKAVDHNERNQDHLSSLPPELRFMILRWLDHASILNVRLINREWCGLASDPHWWGDRSPHVDVTEPWKFGFSSESFGNIIFNRTVYSLLLELAKYKDFVETRGQFSAGRIGKFMDVLSSMANEHTDLRLIYDCFKIAYNSFRKRVVLDLDELDFLRLGSRGGAERSIIHSLQVISGMPFTKESPFYGSPRYGKTIRLAERLHRARDALLQWRALDTNAYANIAEKVTEYINNGIFIKIDHLRSARMVYYHLKGYEMAAKYAKAAADHSERNLNDFRQARMIYYHSKKYEMAAEYAKAVADHSERNLNDFRVAFKCFWILRRLETATEYAMAALSHPEKNNMDLINATFGCLNVAKSKEAAEFAKIVFASPDSTVEQKIDAEGCYLYSTQDQNKLILSEDMIRSFQLNSRNALYFIDVFAYLQLHPEISDDLRVITYEKMPFTDAQKAQYVAIMGYGPDERYTGQIRKTIPEMIAALEDIKFELTGRYKVFIAKLLIRLNIGNGNIEASRRLISDFISAW